MNVPKFIMQHLVKRSEGVHDIRVTDQEFHTIIASLRFYQEKGQGCPWNRSAVVHDLATNGGDVVSLDDVGIDQLVTSLNCGIRNLEGGTARWED